MIKVVEVSEAGGPERLEVRKVELGAPGPGELRLRQTFVGVNFVDVYQRAGLYALPAYPAVPGVEAVGTVEALGEGVAGFAIGDRAAYAGLPAGSYAGARNLPADRVVKLPDDLDDRQVAGRFLRGLTAYLLLQVARPVRAGDRVLIHAAAGGLGLVLTRWVKDLGATAIGTVGSPEKADLARAHGLDHAILYKQDDFVAAVKALTAGVGVDYAVEGIGGETLARTLEAVKPFGVVANVGQVGGRVPQVEIHGLTNRFLIRPSVLAFLTDTTAYRAAADGWFARLRQETEPPAGQEFAMDDAATAHARMEAGATSGAVRLRV